MFKLFIVFTVLFNFSLIARDGFPDEKNSNGGFFSSIFKGNTPKNLTKTGGEVRISATGIGVAPRFAHSPAQAYALAKRAIRRRDRICEALCIPLYRRRSFSKGSN